MCAIFGQGGFEEEGLLPRMAEALVHRGPDGEGFHREPSAAFSMGARRLAIIDLAGGDQPLFNEDRSLVLCCNGEIYNYVELRRELEGLGHRFGTRVDTEVVLHGWEEWGSALLERLNGMFAFSLWDRGKRELILARDRSGQKPLYLWAEGGRIVFASEIKALLLSREVPRRPNREAIEPFLALRYVPEPATMFEGIETLPAAHWARWTPSEGLGKARRYWQVPIAEDKDLLPQKGAADAVDDALRRAVRLCLRSDVPVASYLSGGVDSALLAAYAHQEVPGLETFSIGFGSPVDETEAAAETARFLGTTHHSVHCGPEDFTRLPEVVAQMDRPVGDALVLAFDRLAATASDRFKVVLSGEGADEIFAGYSFHRILRLAERAGVSSRGAASAAAAVVERLPLGLLDRLFPFPAALGATGRRRVAEFLRSCTGEKLDSTALRTLWSDSERGSLLLRPGSTGWKSRLEIERGDHFLDRLLAMQWDEWLQDWSLIRQDKNAMAHSLEVRCPFLDNDLIELGFRLPESAKLRPGADKAVLREVAERHLPRKVARRAKVPFFFPAEFFLENRAFRDLLSATLAPEVVKRRGYFDADRVQQLVGGLRSDDFLSAKQVISLVILELWHQQFMD